MDLGWFETSLDVKDIDRSIAFYEKLGFQFVEGAVEVRTVTLNRGDCRLTLFQDTLDPAQTQLIFWQGDVEAIVSDLAAQGMSFAKPFTRGENGASVMLMDPDGHPVFLITMPVHFVNQAGYEREAPKLRPVAANESDISLGWFALGLSVEDLEQSLAFYTKLGFEVASRGRDGRSVTIQRDHCRVELCQTSLVPAAPQLIFRQGDVEAIALELSARGLLVERYQTDGDGLAPAVVRDPDGHRICFVNEPGGHLS